MNPISIAWSLLGEVEKIVRPGYIISFFLFSIVIVSHLGFFDLSAGPNIASASWGLLNFSVVLFAYAIWRAEKGSMSYAAAEMAKGAMLAGSCVFLHRLWWAVGVWLKPEDGSLPYWEFSVEFRWITVFFVIGIVRGVLRATAPFIRKLLKKYPPQIFVCFELAVVFLAGISQLAV